MKKTIFLFAIICFFSTMQMGFAQSQVTTLQHKGVTSVFYGQTSFADAYTAAAAKGDTLILTVGGFPPPSGIAKGITIIGAGYMPDSTSVKRRTTILGNLTINAGADSLHLEGLYINGDILGWNNPIHYVKIIRCRFVNFSPNLAAKDNCSIEECIIEGGITLNPGTNFQLKHNIINGGISTIYANAVIDGNVLLNNHSSNSLFHVISSSTIKNNIILYSNATMFYDGGTNTLYNNLFVASTISFWQSYNNYESNNYYSVAQADIFVNQTGNVFNFSHDYHLKNPELYIGTDGTQVGLYGGITPFKEMGVPTNPQVTTKTISKETDANGNLQINITVKAQKN